MSRISDLHNGWMDDPEYRREYEALEEEFALASAMIRARKRAGLTQEDLAKEMETSQSAPSPAWKAAARSPPAAR